jgi:ABC-type antimicrobial peptide transport system permease subunit
MLVSDLADRAIADYRARAVLLGLIGALCLPLALAGIAGALSYATSQRVREIGIRMALGAAPADIRRRVLGRAFTAVSLGLVVGLAGGMLMGRLMSSYLFGVRPIDGWTIVGAAAVLILTAWAASILPARRAARIEPAQALREGV